jgi:hypothetical protein
VTTLEPRYAEIGVLVDGDYRQLNANILQIENEYYSTIRPKPSKATKSRPLVALAEGGVDYVEVRTLDLSAADPVGMNQGELRFVEALLIYCLLAESPPISAAEQTEIDARDLTVAREGRRPGLKLVGGGRERGLPERGLELLAGIREVAALLDVDAQRLRRGRRRCGGGAEGSRSHAVGGAALPRYATSKQPSSVRWRSRTHAAYFRDFALAPARSKRSSRRRAALEEAEALPTRIPGRSRIFTDYFSAGPSPRVGRCGPFCEVVNRRAGRRRGSRPSATRDRHEDRFSALSLGYRRLAWRPLRAGGTPGCRRRLGRRERRPCKVLDSLADGPDRGDRRRGQGPALNGMARCCCRRSSWPSRCSSSTSRFAIRAATSSASRRATGQRPRLDGDVVGVDRAAARCHERAG